MDNIFYTPKGLFNTTPKKKEEKPSKFNISNEQYDSFSKDQKIQYISDWMHSNTQFNDAQISGMIACWINESGLKRDIYNSQEKEKWTGNNDYKYGRGIAQWSLERNKEYKNWALQTYGTDVYANEDTIDHQLQFAIKEMYDRPAFMNAFSQVETPEQAADIVRRGFENGSAKALASQKHMDSYTKVGSPGASAIYKKDTTQANYVMDVLKNKSKNPIQINDLGRDVLTKQELWQRLKKELAQLKK